MVKVHRIEVRPAPGQHDPVADAVVRDARTLGVDVEEASTARVYLIRAPLSDAQLGAIRERLLADPVTERAVTGAAGAALHTAVVEVHPLPGVMDPVAQTVREAIRDLVGITADVATGWRYDLLGVNEPTARSLAQRLLANTVIQRVTVGPFHPDDFPHAGEHDHAPRSVAVIGLADNDLEKLSREAHLFLSLDEMRAIRDHYRSLGREPADIELETIAQTWSEHCVHKTLKSRIRYTADTATDVIDWRNRPGHTLNPDGSVTIDNLLKHTVAAATHELIAGGLDWTLSVFKDNSGVIAFDDRHAVCVKVETHNHPSAIEPYGGAATGIGGCIRDVIGTGLGARPIANTDVFCVAPPDMDDLPPGTLPPRRVLTQVVAGVRDYGNRMGIPTVSGAVAFDERYVGNPLVYCGCIGVMPRDRVHGAARDGDLIVALGGRTGRDGIHGATFSSAELEHSSADEFSHAVQIGNAIEEKRLLDAIIRARDEHDEPLFHGITDCGAGGFSSAVGEMGAEIGADVHLERAPLKYPGLSYTEVWISEAQERMVLAVPEANLAALERICEEESVELAVLGTFGTPGRQLILSHRGAVVGRLDMRFLHEGIPQPTREATWTPPPPPPPSSSSTLRSAVHGAPPIDRALLTLLADPNIASKHWIIRQYDHEVQGNTVIRPLVGPRGRGPSDAAVVQPVPRSPMGLAISQGLATGIGDPAGGGDPYLMALAAIDECIRNLVCVGADPARIAILDNFCWPSCTKPENLGSLVRAAEGCYDGAKAYRTPFVSGKDSLNNQFRVPAAAGRPERLIEIPPTLLITGIGIVDRVSRCVTSDAKSPGNLLVLVGETTPRMAGSRFAAHHDLPAAAHDGPPAVDLFRGPAAARTVGALIAAGIVRAAHDLSDGGLLPALSEMLIGAADAEPVIGAAVDLAMVHADAMVAAFAETPSRYLLEIAPSDLDAARAALGDVPHAVIGELNDAASLGAAGTAVPVDQLAAAWLGTLDW